MKQNVLKHFLVFLLAVFTLPCLGQVVANSASRGFRYMNRIVPGSTVLTTFRRYSTGSEINRQDLGASRLIRDYRFRSNYGTNPSPYRFTGISRSGISRTGGLQDSLPMRRVTRSLPTLSTTFATPTTSAMEDFTPGRSSMSGYQGRNNTLSSLLSRVAYRPLRTRGNALEQLTSLGLTKNQGWRSRLKTRYYQTEDRFEPGTFQPRKSLLESNLTEDTSFYKPWSERSLGFSGIRSRYLNAGKDTSIRQRRNLFFR